MSLWSSLCGIVMKEQVPVKGTLHGVSVGLRRSSKYSFHRPTISPIVPNGLPEFPRGHAIVLLHRLTELIPDPSFCFRDHPGCSSLDLPVHLSCLRNPPSQPGSIGLLQIDGIPYFQCPPLCLGIATAAGTRDHTATAPDGCINNGGGEHVILLESFSIFKMKKPKMTGLNDYRPVALTSVVMKSFERLVLAYLKNITGPLLDPLQLAYRANRSVDDAVNMGLHFILQHLDKSGTYVRLLFVDFSSAFNTIIPTLLQTKLTQLSVPSSICQWITSFLTDRHQLVKLGKFKSNSRTTSTGAHQGCVLSPLLFSLYTNDCTSTDPSVKLLKFADDTTVIGLIQDGDESAYRQEIEQLAAWCSRNNLELNTLKTVEMIVDFRRNTPALPPLTIMNSTVPTVASFRFLGTTISQDLKWDTHIDATIKKAQQRLYFLRQLRKFNLPQELLIHFYSAVIESVLCTSITVWFGSATKSDMRRLQRTVRTAERIIGAPLPTLQELYTSRVGCELEEKERFWSELDEVMESIPTGERVVIGADLMDMLVRGTQVVLPDDWETTAEVIRETGRKVLGVSSGRRKEDKETWWWNEEVQDSIQRKRLAKKKWDMDRTEVNKAGIQGVTAQSEEGGV
ncbi:hypothetical protein QTP70_004055 [Hemibagrus guttatus]|uniref:Reverse transcriptase domain-containing protein n=1 Tax=Hemibagrus guttatus TaxID=175788 RepID=A0AAE0R6W7_9TELE|nr:hypothetical protein QTP70_004055 [Hemibagrus guttatus]